MLENAKHIIRQLLALQEAHVGENGCQQTMHQTAHILLMVRTVFKNCYKHWLAFGETLLMNQITHFIYLLQQKILIQNFFFWVIRLF